ncbi:hypothetical protein [Caballeronia insecticola]|nr:hypothetical protein [Caballeronia insecticola]
MDIIDMARASGLTVVLDGRIGRDSMSCHVSPAPKFVREHA